MEKCFAHFGRPSNHIFFTFTNGMFHFLTVIWWISQRNSCNILKFIFVKNMWFLSILAWFFHITTNFSQNTFCNHIFYHNMMIMLLSCKCLEIICQVFIGMPWLDEILTITKPIIGASCKVVCFKRPCNHNFFTLTHGMIHFPDSNMMNVTEK